MQKQQMAMTVNTPQPSGVLEATAKRQTGLAYLSCLAVSAAFFGFRTVSACLLCIG